MTGAVGTSILDFMIPPAMFALLHLVIVVAVLAGLWLSARPSRMAHSRHRGARYRRLTSDEMLKRLRGARN